MPTPTPTHTPAPTREGDVALLIDISDSMARDTCDGPSFSCVYTCDTVSNAYNTDCHPFQEVKVAALSLLDTLAPNVDRVTVIPFARQVGYCINPGDVWPECAASAYDPGNGKFGNKYVPLTFDIDAARTFILNLDIAIPEWAGYPPIDPGLPCPGRTSAEGWDPRLCTNTNIGGGVRAALTELTKELDPNYPGGGPDHPSADNVRVMVLMTDGVANASGLGAEGADYGAPAAPPIGALRGFCPRYTWYPVGAVTGPFCRAPYPVLTGPKQDLLESRHISTSVYYDAADYLLDWTDLAMLNPPDGSGVKAFAIGLGNYLISNPVGDPSIAEKLLRYISAAGDDGDLATDPCSGVDVGQSCGNYYYAPDAASLPAILSDIGTRLHALLGR